MSRPISASVVALLAVLAPGGGSPDAAAAAPATTESAFLAQVESAARARRTTLRQLEADVVVRIDFSE